MTLECWEFLSYIVTVIGLSLAIFVFIYDRAKERENDEEEVYQLLSDNCATRGLQNTAARSAAR